MKNKFSCIKFPSHLLKMEINRKFFQLSLVIIRTLKLHPKIWREHYMTSIYIYIYVFHLCSHLRKTFLMKNALNIDKLTKNVVFHNWR